MRSTRQCFVASLLFLLTLAAAPAANGQTMRKTVQPAFRLHLVGNVSSVDVMCVLVRREERGPDAVLYFVTTAQWFKDPHSEPLPYPQSMTVKIDGGRVLNVRPEDVSLGGSLVDVAVFKVVARDTALVPPALTLAVPSVGTPFFVSGFDVNGAPVQSVQRVGRIATLNVVGDRTVSAVADCRGAPAIGEHGVFGIVTDCTEGMPPIIVPLSAIAKWIGRYVPGGLTLQAPVVTRFEFDEHFSPQENGP